MKDKIIQGINSLFKKNKELPGSNPSGINNAGIRLGQLKMLIAIIISCGLIIGTASLFIKSKALRKSKKVVEEPVLTVELADKNLDPEKHWRNYFEEKQARIAKDMEEKLVRLAADQEAVISKANERIEEELAETKEKLEMAQKELASASLDLKRAAKADKDSIREGIVDEAELEEQDFDTEVELDKPKSARSYIPEGTYFTGHLLGGIAVSTGLNTPDENATPVAIKLMGRYDARGRQTTNLSSANRMELGNCRIMGSSYGDLSSERAIIRLEKMVCEEQGVYITSKIAGQIFGPDGLNGVKGTVVATSSKHIKNAAIGGLISGLAGSAKGQEGATISGAGLVTTKKKGAKSLLGEGVLQGTSNAGDKIADYYLRQAESMSPVLTVPSGARINAQITKGFFVGEVSTHKKIKAARSGNKPNSSDIKEDNRSEYTE